MQGSEAHQLSEAAATTERELAEAHAAVGAAQEWAQLGLRQPWHLPFLHGRSNDGFAALPGGAPCCPLLCPPA